MTKRNQKPNGVPRPYASTTIPTPKKVFERLFAPFKIWEVLLFAAAFVLIGLYALNTSYGYEYSSTLSTFGGIGAAFAVGLGFWTNSTSKNDVPSIGDVQRTVEYVRASSRLSILTSIGGISVITFTTVAHLFSSSIIDDSTRFTVIILMSLAYLTSFLIVRTLISYTPDYGRSSITFPVEVSSIPEIVTVIGFVVAPSVVFIAGFFWDTAPILETPFTVTLIDTLVVLTVLQFLYISLVVRY